MEFGWRCALMESGKADHCGARSDGAGEFGESRREPVPEVEIHTEFVVSAAEFLHKRVPGR